MYVIRDMSVDEAVELARRSIFHATHRDAASGGVVSGKFNSTGLAPISMNRHCTHTVQDWGSSIDGQS